ELLFRVQLHVGIDLRERLGFDLPLGIDDLVLELSIRDPIELLEEVEGVATERPDEVIEVLARVVRDLDLVLQLLEDLHRRGREGVDLVRAEIESKSARSVRRRVDENENAEDEREEDEIRQIELGSELSAVRHGSSFSVLAAFDEDVVERQEERREAQRVDQIDRIDEPAGELLEVPVGPEPADERAELPTDAFADPVEEIDHARGAEKSDEKAARHRYEKRDDLVLGGGGDPGAERDVDARHEERAYVGREDDVPVEIHDEVDGDRHQDREEERDDDDRVSREELRDDELPALERARHQE